MQWIFADFFAVYPCKSVKSVSSVFYFSIQSKYAVEKFRSDNLTLIKTVLFFFPGMINNS